MGRGPEVSPTAGAVGASWGSQAPGRGRGTEQREEQGFGAPRQGSGPNIIRRVAGVLAASDSGLPGAMSHWGSAQWWRGEQREEQGFEQRFASPRQGLGPNIVRRVAGVLAASAGGVPGAMSHWGSDQWWRWRAARRAGVRSSGSQAPGRGRGPASRGGCPACWCCCYLSLSLSLSRSLSLAVSICWCVAAGGAADEARCRGTELGGGAAAAAAWRGGGGSSEATIGRRQPTGRC